MEILKTKSYRDQYRNIMINKIDKSLFHFYPNSENILVSYDGKTIKNSITNHIYKLFKNRDGYLGCNIKLLNGRRKSIFVHRLVAETFLPYLNSDYYEVNHKDCNKSNNSLDNLEWMTRQENLEYAREARSFRGLKGENSNSSKWSFQDIKDMRELKQLGFNLKEIMECYNISKTYLSQVLNKKRRSDV